MKVAEEAVKVLQEAGLEGDVSSPETESGPRQGHAQDHGIALALEQSPRLLLVLEFHRWLPVLHVL